MKYVTTEAQLLKFKIHPILSNYDIYSKKRVGNSIHSIKAFIMALILHYANDAQFER